MTEDHPRVSQIDHITLVVRDLAVSRQFYVDILGMEEVPRPAFTFQGCWFQAGETLIHLILEHEQSPPAGNPLSPENRHGRAQHVAFLVDDGPAAYEWICENGVPVVGAPKRRPDGAYQFFVTDPDGHVIELCMP